MLRYTADQIGCGCADDPAHVVGKSHRGTAERRGKQFAGDHGESTEVSSSKEADQGADEQEGCGLSYKREQRHKHRCCYEIADVRIFPAETVRQKAEADVAQKRAYLHDDGPSRGADDAESAAAFRHRHREKTWNPGEKSPPGEECRG